MHQFVMRRPFLKIRTGTIRGDLRRSLGCIETRDGTHLSEPSGVDPVFLYLVVNEALGCAEKFGCMALIALRTPESLYDKLPFIGIDTRLQIDVCYFLIFCFHGYPHFDQALGIGLQASGKRYSVFYLMPEACSLMPAFFIRSPGRPARWCGFGRPRAGPG